MQSFEEIREICRSSNAEDVRSIVNFMLWECEIEQGPSIEEVRLWHTILNERGNKFVKIAAICQEWLTEEATDAKE